MGRHYQPTPNPRPDRRRPQSPCARCHHSPGHPQSSSGSAKPAAHEPHSPVPHKYYIPAYQSSYTPQCMSPRGFDPRPGGGNTPPRRLWDRADEMFPDQFNQWIQPSPTDDWPEAGVIPSECKTLSQLSYQSEPSQNFSHRDIQDLDEMIPTGLPSTVCPSLEGNRIPYNFFHIVSSVSFIHERAPCGHWRVYCVSCAAEETESDDDASDQLSLCSTRLCTALNSFP